ncbi:multidrug efflux RND transporter permease subunit [Methylosinus sp. Ce-a6]|uniref:multidrug efflux RND transporter permease subunit n=1 Tax=Methylosinus sp. Ce-a6 TaxID=2172005 RepID=UPI00135C282C|nr:multidrug efflux RND transporter permease subunit [Methylosinus sp. Ce-a6]
MNISEIFIRRPIATSLLMLGMLIFGAASYRLLPVAALPNIDIPTITVAAQLPGASPDTMASSVAAPLEQQFASIPGLSQMTSTSGLGISTITLQFDLDRSIDAAASDVQTAINAASGLLPKDLPNPPTYKKTNPTDRPVLVYAVHSDAMPIHRVDDYANLLVAQKISTVPGVSQVTIAGQQKFAVRAQVNPLALASRGVGLEEVRGALAAATLNQAKGALEGPRLSATLDTNDQLFSAAGFRDVIVAYRNGAPVMLKDIGDAVDSTETERIGAWFNDKRAEVLLVQRQPGSNAIEIVDTIKAMMPKLRASLPPTVEIDLLTDRSETIRASVDDIQLTLALTIVLVVLVIFAFLRNARATVIPSVVAPLSLFGTFGVMYVLGYSLDNLSLMALTIAVGFVVDDAIVMIENVVRHIEAGKSPIEAALEGSGQIGFTIVSITVSLIAVFIPLLFMGGVVGRLFREFAVTVTVAVLVSAFISLTLTPVMCSLFLEKERAHQRGAAYGVMEAFFDWMLRGYERGLQWAFRHQLSMLLSTIALIAVTGYLYMTIPKGLFPEQDTGFVFGQLEARQDISFTAMAELEQEVAKIILADPAVSGVAGFVGATANNASQNTARLVFQLEPFGVRDVSAQEVVQRLRPKVARILGAIFYMQAAQDITIGGRLSKTLYQYTLTGTDAGELNAWAPQILAEMQKLPELQGVTSDQQIAGAQVAIEVDRDAASRLGVSLGLVDQTLYDAFGQRQIATIYSSTNQYRLILEVQSQFREDATALQHIYISGTNGAQVPLSAVARYVSKVEPLTVNHQGQFPAVTISFNLRPGAALGTAVEKIREMQERLRWPPTIEGSFQGTAGAFQASLASTPRLVLAAVLVVYIVLGMLYESYIHPITILSALPSAGVGALIMLMLFHYDLSIIALIGIILLIGIVKKNAIMMIDFALEAERHHGKTPLEAIHQACLLRFRPIMMTTMAAIFGGLPLAIGYGAGSELRRPLGIAIIGGLLVSQFLTLYTTPIIYLYLDRATLRLAEWRQSLWGFVPGGMSRPAPTEPPEEQLPRLEPEHVRFDPSPLVQDETARFLGRGRV